MAVDSAGNIYGTTYAGGLAGYGVVYKIDNTGAFAVLHSFMGGLDGENPYYGRLIFDPAGNLYGTTSNGGASGAGTVFEISASGAETILYAFTGGADGSNPYAGVVLDEAGNLYGTTFYGGTHSYGGGVVFKLSSDGTETVLWDFSLCALCSTSASFPSGDLIYVNGTLYGTAGSGALLLWKLNATGAGGLSPIVPGAGEVIYDPGVYLDARGNLYGTFSGSSSQDPYTRSAGGVYEITAAGKGSSLYTFTGGADGGTPYGAVTVDAEGNVYGTTSGGGLTSQGVIYKITPAAQESVIYNFPQVDGSYPYAGLIGDEQGNLYGATYNGGANGQGAVFKVTAQGQETVLYSFQAGSDGANPYGGLAIDSAGNLYGTTVSGGGSNNDGTVFKIDPSGDETILYAFGSGAHDGANPYGGLILDSEGNLYGTTLNGGSSGQGAVFKIAASGNESVLYSFSGDADGGLPYSGLIRDAAGNLYGTASAGGADNNGVVYMVNPAGVETVLYRFKGGSDGSNPQSVLTAYDGNFYGTTLNGGVSGAGAVFQIDSTVQETVLYSFTGGSDGGHPYGGVILDSSGNLYGTASTGGASKAGAVYKVSASGGETVLYSFTGGSDGGAPNSGLTAGPKGVLYGTAYGNGPYFRVPTLALHFGVVFAIVP